MTIHQTIEIPASRRVYFDVRLPKETACGRTEVVLDFKTPVVQTAVSGSAAKTTLDPVLEAVMTDAERKWADNRAHPEKLQAALEKLREGGGVFGGVDGVEFQRKIRDGWKHRTEKAELPDNAAAYNGINRE
jgi:hypothetical protein